MTSARPVPRRGWSSWLAVALAFAGALQVSGLIALALQSQTDGGILASSAFWPLWLAIVLTVLLDDVRLWARYLVSLLAVMATGVSLAVQLTLWPGWPLLSWWSVSTAGSLVAAVALAAWSVLDVIARRPRREEPESSAGPEAEPASPATPPSANRQLGSSDGGWTQMGAPWPRAVEDDPEGTLIRPPRRRS